jgi:hypothetical protein
VFVLFRRPVGALVAHGFCHLGRAGPAECHPTTLDISELIEAVHFRHGSSCHSPYRGGGSDCDCTGAGPPAAYPGGGPN